MFGSMNLMQEWGGGKCNRALIMVETGNGLIGGRKEVTTNEATTSKNNTAPLYAANPHFFLHFYQIKRTLYHNVFFCKYN